MSWGWSGKREGASILDGDGVMGLMGRIGRMEGMENKRQAELIFRFR